MQPTISEKPVNMENLPVNNGNGQSFGYTLYETTIGSPGVLRGLVRDRGQVGASPLPSCVLAGTELTASLSFALACPAGTSVYRWASQCGLSLRLAEVPLTPSRQPAMLSVRLSGRCL